VLEVSTGKKDTQKQARYKATAEKKTGRKIAPQDILGQACVKEEN